METDAVELYPLAPDPHGLEQWMPGHVPDGTDRSLLAERIHRSLVAPVREVMEAGGRRWRPAIGGQVVSVLGGDRARFALVLAAMEIAHTGSLIVDDVEDGAALRRGRPAAHLVHGVPTALNAGTNAYFAMDVALRRCVPDDVLLRGEMRERYMEALRAAHTGQALDIQGHREEMDRAVARGDAAGLLEVVRLTHRLKSGAVVGAVLEMAALFTAAGSALRGALTAFGSALGTAYQIADDVADLHGVTRQGKATRRAAEDLHHGKITMPLAHSVRLMPPPELDAVWRTLRTGAPSLREVERAREAIEACGAPAACAEEARALLDGAWTRLRPLLPDEPAADRIHDSARAFVDGSLFS
ncbi:polyprenyl synthetase family protein [Streptomyces sp. NPDC017448]|uniref:polyprenyl synthetase family protein n=1 Tax=Streptomyces sp. NPDC017448 TaxID=3364996 RepID=UPI0037BC0DD6